MLFQIVVPDANVKNFTNDWNDGRVLSALVETCLPGAIPDWKELDPMNAVENITAAMQVLSQTWSHKRLGGDTIRTQLGS